MKIYIEDKPFSTVRYYSGEVTELDQIYPFTIMEDTNLIDVTFTENTPPFEKALKETIVSRFIYEKSTK